MRALKLQLDYVLARNIPQSDIRKERELELLGTSRSTLTTVQFFSASRYSSTNKRNRGIPLQPKIDVAGLKDEECRTKFRQRVSIHVGVWIRKELSVADSFTKCILDPGRETLPVLLPRKKFVFASAETKSTYNSVSRAELVTSTRKSVLEGSCVVDFNKAAIMSGRQERWSLNRRGRTRTRGKPMLY
ncbi:hypothetical protein RB195_019018 [Necator americanus]|uniref:Uncharacterized protein n=1 Tax=Necator americanus TaxID=51031 RepID=A0ABR1CE06_NECAM